MTQPIAENLQRKMRTGRGKTARESSPSDAPTGFDPVTGIHPTKGRESKSPCQPCDVKKQETVVFLSNKPAVTDHPQEFGAMDHVAEDDELVYAPGLNMAQLPGVRALTFDGLV